MFGFNSIQLYIGGAIITLLMSIAGWQYAHSWKYQRDIARMSKELANTKIELKNWRTIADRTVRIEELLGTTVTALSEDRRKATHVPPKQLSHVLGSKWRLVARHATAASTRVFNDIADAIDDADPGPAASPKGRRLRP